MEAVSRPRPGDVLSAQDYLRRVVVRTPTIRSAALDERAGCRLVAKAECLQRTGSFKVRGALNRARMLPPEARARGLLTVSAGNAALGLAFAGHVLGASVTVVMPQDAVAAKIDAVRALGGTVNTTYFRCFMVPGVLRFCCPVCVVGAVSVLRAGIVSARVSRRGWRAVPRSAAPSARGCSSFLTGQVRAAG